MIVFQDEILKELMVLYPTYTYSSLKKLVDYGMRKTIKFLNMEHEVAIDGALKYKNYDGVFFCEEGFYAESIDKLKLQKEKELNRVRVNRYNNKNKK